MTLKTLILGGVGADGPHQGVIGSIIQPAVELMFAAAVFFFLWNVFMAITRSDQPAELAKFKSKIGWGIVAIAVMASVWGLVALLLGSTGLDTTSILNIRTGP
jgi:hypothetical protein